MLNLLLKRGKYCFKVRQLSQRTVYWIVRRYLINKFSIFFSSTCPIYLANLLIKIIHNVSTPDLDLSQVQKFYIDLWVETPTILILWHCVTWIKKLLYTKGIILIPKIKSSYEIKNNQIKVKTSLNIYTNNIQIMIDNNDR